ncbi:MAG: preprotein translocase subunit YajC [Myxococcales bacterium]|nr:preprotein translocase subunit YajC [Myxococcales bacterium]
MLLTTLLTAVLLAEGAAAGPGLGGLPMILLMFAVIYFIVLRPMSKQEKDRRKRVDGLQKGDEVVLQGGILGRVTNIDDPKVAVVEIAPKVRIRVLKKDINDTKAAALKDDKDKDKDKADAKAKDDKDKKAKDEKSKTTASDDAKDAKDDSTKDDARKGA